MAAPAQVRTRIAQFLDDAWDAWQSGLSVNDCAQFSIGGQAFKIHVVGRDADHPKEIVIRVKFKV